MMPNNRRPIVITDDRIATGARATHVRKDDPEALLRQYLRLIRRVRSQRRGRHIALRRADIVTLAEHLGWTEDQVLARLADLMGATGRQRATMLAILATGASLITISSPAAATDEAMSDELPIVVIHDDVLAGPAAVSRASRHAPVVGPSVPSGRRPTIATVDGAPGVGGDPITDAPALTSEVADATDDAPRIAETIDPPEQVDEPPSVDAPWSAPAIDDGGNTVAVGLPPIPPGVDDDGNAVAVGPPPVPPAPSSEPAIDDEGDTVAVGLPPVPPPAP